MGQLSPWRMEQRSFTGIHLGEYVRLTIPQPFSRGVLIICIATGVQDPEKPFSNDAQPNSWTPPLSQKWRWGVDRANGVNLGGLFVIEPFITPHFFQQY